MKLGRNVLTWLALLVLLALTCGSVFVPMGRLNVAINLGIAVLKAALVLVVFMHLAKERPVIWLVAAAAVPCLGILVGLSATDFGVRGW